MTKILLSIDRVVWGAPALVLILGVGLWLSVRTGFAQFTLFSKAFKNFCSQFCPAAKQSGTVSPFQALCTALAATVGTGNLVGVAGALAIGGPGAIFWMWICALLGMMTKFAEATLAVRYRAKDASGDMIGGPMYMIRNGMGKRWAWLAGAYSFFGIVAAFGVGNATQVNAVVGGVNQVLLRFGFSQTLAGDLLMGLAIAALVASMLLGGMRRIGAVAERLVPLVSVCYILLSLGVIVLRWRCIDDAFFAIIEGAFAPRAVTGGIVGSAFTALRVGVSRGVFTNEAGMGTAAIAHAAAQVEHPAEQGLMGIMEVFIDTIVICTMTALVILVSGVPVDYGTDAGVTLTAEAFCSVWGDWASVFLAAALSCFALATVLGWGLYGIRCAQYLFGSGVYKKFVMLQAVTVVLGAVLRADTVWLLSETVNGLMAIPNLISLWVLCPELVRLTREYKDMAAKAACGGTYENFHQCKPLRTFSYEKIPPLGGAGKAER